MPKQFRKKHNAGIVATKEKTRRSADTTLRSHCFYPCTWLQHLTEWTEPMLP